ncbi:MAG: hypothetical protein WDW36_002722 [Sanguina aurantia]
MPKVTPLSVHLKFQGRCDYPVPPGVDDWGLTKDQQESYVEQFRRILLAKNAFDSEEHDYYALRRFLRARSYDLEKATKMWLDSLAFRRDQKVDSILQDFYFPERDKFIASFPQGYHKVDKQGRPIYYQIMGKLNLPELMTITTEERLLKFHVQEYERATRVILPVCCKLFAKPIDTTFGILDVKGVGMSHLSSEVKRLLGIITKIDSNNYPETMGHMCIINAPGIFRLMWSIIKGTLDPRTQSKIEILGPNYKEGLLRWIDEENIPEWMGGSSKGGLVDDVGPWSDPEVLSRLDLDVETLRRGRRVSIGSQMAAVSIRRAQSLASRQASLTAPAPSLGSHEPGAQQQQQHRLGVVVEDLHLHPTSALHPTPSIQRCAVRRGPGAVRGERSVGGRGPSGRAVCPWVVGVLVLELRLGLGAVSRNLHQRPAPHPRPSRAVRPGNFIVLDSAYSHRPSLGMELSGGSDSGSWSISGGVLGACTRNTLFQQPSVATLADSFDTTNTNGAGAGRGPVTLASLADLLSTDKPRTLVERITALEKLMPGQLERLKMQVGAANVAHSAAMSTRSAPEGSLLNRVETLEDALTTLLAAQEVCIQQQQADQALCEMRAQVKSRGCCGCCIM